MLGDFPHCKDMKEGNTAYILLCECTPTCNWGQGENSEALRISQEESRVASRHFTGVAIKCWITVPGSWPNFWCSQRVKYQNLIMDGSKS